MLLIGRRDPIIFSEWSTSLADICNRLCVYVCVCVCVCVQVHVHVCERGFNYAYMCEYTYNLNVRISERMCVLSLHMTLAISFRVRAFRRVELLEFVMLVVALVFMEIHGISACFINSP